MLGGLEPEASELAMLPLEVSKEVGTSSVVANRSHMIEVSRQKLKFTMLSRQRVGARRWHRWQIRGE